MRAVRLPYMAILLIAGASLWLAISQRGADAAISDTLGYMQAAHQLARGDGLAFADPHNQIDRQYYMLYAFKVVHPAEPNRYFGFLPGVPLLAAAAERLTDNPDAVQWVTPLAAALLILTTFGLGILLIDAWAGFWGGLILFVAPTFARFSAALWSEIPSALFLYLGFMLVVLALRRASDDRIASGLAILGGLAAGAAFFMRFSNVMVAPAMLALIGLSGGRSAFKQRRAIWLVGVLAAAFIALFVFNTLYYGGPFNTGYSPQHGWYDQPAFSLSYAFGPSFVNGYSTIVSGRELFTALGGLVVFAIVGVFVKERRVGLWLLGTAVVLWLPYAFYAFAAEGLNARFVIPALPALCLLAGRGVVGVGRRVPWRAVRWALGIALFVAILYRAPQNVKALDTARQSSQVEIERAMHLIQPTESNAVILSYVYNDPIAVYGHRSALTYRHMVPYDITTGKYQYSQFEPLLTDEISRLLNAGTPVYYIRDGDPPLYHSDEVLRQHFELAQLATEQPVYRITRRAP